MNKKNKHFWAVDIVRYAKLFMNLIKKPQKTEEFGSEDKGNYDKNTKFYTREIISIDYMWKGTRRKKSVCI